MKIDSHFMVRSSKTLVTCSLLLLPQKVLAGSFLQRLSLFQPRHCAFTTNIKMSILDSPSAERNKDPIWNVLSTKVVPLINKDDDEALRVLEVAAGSGVHTEHFATKLEKEETAYQWYPTDPEESSRTSIQARAQNSKLTNVQPPLPLTLNDKGIIQRDTDSALDCNLSLIICINMIHISPWAATLGLMTVAAQKLKSGGVLYFYGPYIVGGNAVESNLRFSQSLQQRNPEWGVRNLEHVVKAAEKHGLVLRETVEMPANNLSVIFQKP